MPYRPLAEHRKNVQGVLLPLTAAIQSVFGSRTQDYARPIGAFYPRNVSATTWRHVGGIWYSAYDEQKVLNRSVNEAVVRGFAISIMTGEPIVLPSGTQVTWEPIPEADASQLPPPIQGRT